MIKFLIKVFSIALFGTALVACASHEPPPEPVFVPPPAKPSLADVRATYLNQLERNGVQVIHIGETIRIVIRDDYLFVPGSANVLQSEMKVLRTVTLLMNTYDMVDVKVSGYWDNQLDETVAKALTTRQAQVVLNKLRYYGIDTRFLYAVGYGQSNPVAWNGSEQGRSLNRRVEISFQYYPKTKGYN